MSVRAMEWAAESPLTGSDRWVLIALAWFADDATGACFPGQQAIAKWAGLADRTVREALVRLEADGWITREARRTEHGWRTSDLYRLRTGRTPERARKKDAAAEHREALPAPGAASPTGERRRLSPTGASRRSNRRLAPGKEELRSSEPSVEPIAPPALVEIEAPAAQPRAKTTTARGTRVPEDFAPDAALEALARDLVPWKPIATLVAEFIDYWVAVPGAKGLKANWPATFRNHLRREQSFGAPRGWTAPPAAQPAFPEPDDWERRVRAWCARNAIAYGEWLAAQTDEATMEGIMLRVEGPVPTR